MLAHLKAKQREHNTPEDGTAASAPEQQQPQEQQQREQQEQQQQQSSQPASGTPSDPENCPTTTMTCEALCSLSYVLPTQMNGNQEHEFDFMPTGKEKSGKKGMGCPKQHQLPMFLSKTYHMIDRCDSTIASWSPSGDNFVVKNVEKFASSVLPMYFKHSNFSSFARQLNFYGFRKLKAEPILTADFDARTACYVRFYHEKFQKDRPELLAQIKRATKSDQQSKDDVESLKTDIMKLKECLGAMGSEHDRRMSEMSYEYNRRITALSAEYDKLAMLVQQVLANQGTDPSLLVGVNGSAAGKNGVPDMMRSLSQVAAMSLQNSLRPPSLTAAAAAASAPSTTVYIHQGQQKRPPEGDSMAGAPMATRPRHS